eukprot:441735_1
MCNEACQSASFAITKQTVGVVFTHQMISIGYDESMMDMVVDCFPKLKVIRAADPNSDSLHQIVTNAPYMEHFDFICSVNQPQRSSHKGFSEKTMQNTVDALFCKRSHLKEVSIKAGHAKIQQIMKWMGSALFHTNLKQITFIGNGRHLVV